LQILQAAVTVAAKAEQVSRARGFILKERLVLRVCTIFFMLLNFKTVERGIFHTSLEF
jgi:hypothetical protein